MKRPPRPHADKAIEPERKRPLWEKLEEPLELYISPELKLRLGLPPKIRTTAEWLEKRKKP